MSVTMKALFERLPTELSEEIFSYLQVKTLAVLALVSRSLYAAVQTPLYRHPRIPSFSALSLFVRTLNQVSTYSAKGKRWLWWKDERPLNKDVVDLHVTINSVDDVSQTGERPLAIIISRLITAITNHCPTIDITLCFVRSHPHHAPIKDLEKESFPRVTKLVLYLGSNRPGRGSPYTWPPVSHFSSFSSRCSFWRPYMNGSSFPDCRSFELNQCWDDLPIGARAQVPKSSVTSYEGPTTPGDIDASLAALGPLKGLEKLESISLAWPTDMSSATMAAIFSPQATSAAANLKTLELRYCNVNYEVMAALMRQCLPVLKHFTLLYGPDDPSGQTRQQLKLSQMYGSQGDSTHDCHLCPLIRKFAQDLTSLKFAAPFVCREMFIDEEEQDLLHTVGIDTAVGYNHGSLSPGKSLDNYAITQILSHHRTKQSSKRQYASSCNRERIIVSWKGLCNAAGTWQELETEANLEAPGVSWTLMNLAMQQASRHRAGEVPDVLMVDHVLRDL